MRARYRRRKCHCCRQWFMPQPHNAYHQHFCSRDHCRLTSRRASSRRFRRKHRDADICDGPLAKHACSVYDAA
ncbi:MAG: hypothetical protein HQ559_11560 [Lentisphaerae bacterium]|nr:hypothetical protein [Lentisphaerota bacterium]